VYHGQEHTHEILLALVVLAIDVSRETTGYVAELGKDILSYNEALIELKKLTFVNRRTGRFGLPPLTKA
jgi:hypothetical protein